MVSSAKPKVVPPAAISVVTKIMRIYSLPLSIFAIQAIPASKAPVRFMIPIKPPIMRIKKMISEAAMIPFPKEEVTPPVIKMYFVCEAIRSGGGVEISRILMGYKGRKIS